jgi:hypothetical protein
VSIFTAALSTTHEDPHNAAVWSALQTALRVSFLAVYRATERSTLYAALRTANKATQHPTLCRNNNFINTSVDNQFIAKQRIDFVPR